MNDPFVISRTFDAPLDRVWAAWTEPSRIGAWMTPRGSGELTMLKFDLPRTPRCAVCAAPTPCGRSR